MARTGQLVTPVDDSGNVLGTAANPLVTSGSGGTSAAPNIIQSQGSTNVATTQAQAPITTSAQIVGARSGRNAVTITNITGAQQVYVGPSGVTASGVSGGALIPATVGASITIPTSAAIFGISLTAAQTVSILETF